jgi:hypothetical protein
MEASDARIAVSSRGRWAGMNSAAIGLSAFAAIFTGAVLGLLGARRLPSAHLSAETRTAVSVSMAVVGTLSALVIGDLAIDVLRLDRSLARYGAEAEPVRASLRGYAEAKLAELSVRHARPGDVALPTLALLENVGDQILDLHPADDRQRRIQAQATRFVEAIADARWLLIEKGEVAVPGAFLGLLIFWLASLFASFGLFAPANGVALVALLLCSLAIAGGIFMILELASPMGGLVQPSLSPLHAAMVQLRASSFP